MGSARRLLRWMMPLAAGLGGALGMGLLFCIDLKTPRGGLAGLVKMGLDSPSGIRFGLALVLRELLPLHMLMGLLAWLAFFLPGAFLFGREWRHEWRGRQGFLGAASGLAWIHVCYWWKVPPALWVVPGARCLPLWLALPLLGMLALLPVLWMLRGVPARWMHRAAALFFAVLLWSALAQLPLVLAHHSYRPPSKAGHPAKLLMVAIDGLREDVANRCGLGDFRGTRFPNAYSPLPATRLLYHLIWGGDPDFYSVGHVVPALEEYGRRMPLRLLDEAQARGWKVRFCIDDGGTIGLSGRSQDFDAIYMPASGWENFVNSNLAVHFPLYAAWMDVLRVFPSTNPWSDPASGLARTLEAGRGADWVMFHSCLAHQPIFLSRRELGQMPGWWRLQARDFEPKGSWQSIDQRDVDHWSPQRSPALAYQIRMATLLEIYRSVWNRLDEDPDYRTATRVFFSDHGERFYHVTEQIQLQGVHGFGLDPWEMRIPLVVKTPEAASEPRVGRAKAVSLLDLRDGIWGLLQGRGLEPEAWGAKAFAPGRYHTILSEDMRPSGKKFRQQTKEQIVSGTFIGPSGLWVMNYNRPASERSKDVTLARAVQDRLTVFKPLEGGGAQKTEYQGYRFLSEEDVDEASFQEAKREIEMIFLHQPWGPGGDLPGTGSGKRP